MSAEALIEFRTIVEYDGDEGNDQLIYGPDLEDDAEKHARAAAKRWIGRDFEGARITVESREVQPWSVVVAHRQPDRTPPHPAEDVANDPTLAEEADDAR